MSGNGQVSSVQERMRELWRRATNLRHRSELRALRLARKLGPFAEFPIFLNLMFWWFALGLTCIALGPLAFMMMDSEGFGPRIVGGVIFTLVSVYAVVILLAGTPWFFRWYFITVGLMFGRTGMADRKEAELIAAIAASEATFRLA